MRRIETSLPGAYLIEPVVWSDERGFFFESYHEAKYAELGIPAPFVQDNHAKSGRSTLRGLHYQINRPQAKLCRVVQGEVLDVIVDIRYGSPHFGRHECAQIARPIPPPTRAFQSRDYIRAVPQLGVRAQSWLETERFRRRHSRVRGFHNSPTGANRVDRPCHEP